MLKYLHAGKVNRIANNCRRNLNLPSFVESITGVPAINLAGIDPLLINKIQLRQGTDSPVNVELTFNDVQLTGLKDHICTFVK